MSEGFMHIVGCLIVGSALWGYSLIVKRMTSKYTAEIKELTMKYIKEIEENRIEPTRIEVKCKASDIMKLNSLDDFRPHCMYGCIRGNPNEYGKMVFGKTSIHFIVEEECSEKV